MSSWNAGKVKGTHEEARVLNGYLKQIEAAIFESYRELTLSKKPFTADTLKDAYLGIETDEYSLMSLMEYHNSYLKDTLEWGTMKNYHTTQKYVKMFLHKRRVRDILLNQLSYRFVVDFELFLRAHKPIDHHLPMGNNTVMKHIERLKKMVNVAIKNEWLEKDPFAKFQSKFIRTERGFLNEDELKSIEKRVLKIPRLQLVRDLFVFSCYTGLPYCDVMQLTPENICVGMDREYWIMTSRIKTNQSVRVPLLPAALQIIKKYKSNPRSAASETVFPGLSNQKLNAYLKEVADLCNVKKNLTFHLARHTFATTITLTNGVPIESVSKMLGHTSIKTTQIYAKVLEQKVSHDMKQLKTLLKSQSTKKSLKLDKNLRQRIS